jgi:hypothetical protein
MAQTLQIIYSIGYTWSSRTDSIQTENLTLPFNIYKIDFVPSRLVSLTKKVSPKWTCIMNYAFNHILLWTVDEFGLPSVAYSDFFINNRITQDENKQNRKKPQYVLDTTIRKQTQITYIRHEPSYKQLEDTMVNSVSKH